MPPPLQHDADVDRELEHRREDQKRRRNELQQEAVFESERFAIGALQAVSGASVVAAISQAKTIITLAGSVAFNSFLTLMSIALSGAIFRAFARHQYKKWDLKANASLDRARGAIASQARGQEEVLQKEHAESPTGAVGADQGARANNGFTESTRSHDLHATLTWDATGTGVSPPGGSRPRAGPAYLLLEPRPILTLNT